jgi:acyl-coenzyme A thioesterase PaaI-like protein
MAGGERGNGMFERVRESFARQGIMGLLGARMTEVGEGRCVVEVPYSDGLGQQQRYFHGAVAGAIADSAGLCGADPRARGPGGAHGRVQDQLPRPRAGGEAGGSGEVLSAGRRLFVRRAEVFAVSAEGEETPCAMLHRA